MNDPFMVDMERARLVLVGRKGRGSNPVPDFRWTPVNKFGTEFDWELGHARSNRIDPAANATRRFKDVDISACALKL
jgi:hypothetical protein